MTFNAEKVIGHPLVMLSGEEEVLRRRALIELHGLATHDGDFDLQVYEADEIDPGEWLASAGTAPFLSERRTVIVRHLLRRSLDDGVPKGFERLPKSAFLLLVADEEPGDENRQRRLQTVRKAWEKLVKDAGGFVADFSTNSKDLHASIRTEAVRLGKKLSDGGAEILAEMTGANLSRALDELEKLAIYVGSEPQIRQADVRTVVVPSREWNVFKLIDAIIDGAVPEALRQLRILVGSQTKAEEAAFSRILPTLSRQLRLLWQARLCVDAGCSPSEPPPEIRRLFPAKPNLTREQPYRHHRLMQQARRTDLDALALCLRAVSDADAKIKGQLDSFSTIESLELMVLEMVQALAPSRARPDAARR